MRKRVLFIFILVLSVGPAVLASDIMSEKICLSRAGENSQCQLERAVGAPQCDRQKALDEAIAEQKVLGGGAAGAFSRPHSH